ncbi:hypothetical protein BpHYR1_020682 [Brachionus plicatilis]|uniref:Uncharacterized protein n=1 Tax=Brachionus plicatilis TaxID=10195 RepID=A0A3M7T7N1_BRAPC|nr:hypothetical protein BpHYR1_020682 [Brachionus plicatilis]
MTPKNCQLEKKTNKLSLYMSNSARTVMLEEEDKNNFKANSLERKKERATLALLGSKGLQNLVRQDHILCFTKEYLKCVILKEVPFASLLTKQD